MVILDSDHAEPHVAREIQLYKDFVGIGYYLIVEDTNINGHPTLASFGPGPMEAVNAFISTTDEFCIDHARTRFLMTLNPGGYLKRVKDP
jgi:cephalosporin hydroxylase